MSAARFAAVRRFRGCSTVHEFSVAPSRGESCYDCTRKAHMLPNGFITIRGLKRGDEVEVSPSSGPDYGGWARVTVTPAEEA